MRKIGQFIALCIVGALTATASADVLVETPQGRLDGMLTKDGDVAAFKGIPYAVPPVGMRRWKHAEPAPAWKGVRDAAHFGPECMQPDGSPTSFYYAPTPVRSEDCLYLNVWAPEGALKNDKKLPVMVWIHGGALVSGAGSDVDGTELARKDVVVVSINYRLNIFGYYAHPELSAETTRDTSGNYGISDQIEALRWVQENISAFGGDPENVTIFGESAGSWSVGLMMATPKARGLFHKAIGESSAYFYSMRYLKKPGLGMPSLEESGAAFAARAGKSLGQLRELTAQELMKVAFEKQALNVTDMVPIDNYYYSQSVYDTFASGHQAKVPMMVGFNSDEASGLYGIVGPIPETAEEYERLTKERFGDLAEEYLKLYPSSDPVNSVFDAHRDNGIGWMMESWAKMMANLTPETYLYYFSHTPPGSDVLFPIRPKHPENSPERRIGAFHASEIPFVFNDLTSYNPKAESRSKSWPKGKITKTHKKMADTMSDYWVAFARTGKPAVKGQPEWQPYSDQKEHFMEFTGGKAKPGMDLLDGAWELQDQINKRRYETGVYWQNGKWGFDALLPGNK